MIKINLTPFEELDDPQWWVPDAALLVLLIAVTFGGLYAYISMVESQIEQRELEKTNRVTETTNLQGDVQKFNDLNGKITTLTSRKESLKKITESKLMRYLPVILMENIQNLKPDKVWLTGLAFIDKKKADAVPAAPQKEYAPNGQEIDRKADINAQTKDKINGVDPDAQAAKPDAPAAEAKEFPVTIEIAGGAVDNVAISEFMMSLKSTQNQTYEKNDLRTQLSFSDVGIVFSQITTDNGSKDQGPDVVNFKLILTFKEKKESGSDAKFSEFIDQFNKTGQAKMY